MKPHQRMRASDGKEVMLFPLTYMDISQGENESYSHAGTYNIDFIGWGVNGRVYQAPLYAPCSCRCVATIDAINKGRVFESLKPVHTPGGLMYVTFMFFHDNNPIASVGSVFTQGDLIGHTGTAGGVGDHTHLNCAIGGYVGWEHVPPDNNGQLINSTHIYDICYVNNTVIRDDYGYNWRVYGGILKRFNKNKFPWVLYGNKLRNRYNLKNK